MNTLEDRLKHIEKASVYKAKEERKQELLKEKDYNETMKKLDDLKERIRDIIMVANECINKGVYFPYHENDSCYSNDINNTNFFADYRGFLGFMGYIGFPHHTPSELKRKGIKSLGFSREYHDFYVDENSCYQISTTDRNREEACLEDIKYFIEVFDKFEKKFYEWVDNLKV